MRVGGAPPGPSRRCPNTRCRRRWRGRHSGRGRPLESADWGPGAGLSLSLGLHGCPQATATLSRAGRPLSWGRSHPNLGSSPLAPPSSGVHLQRSLATILLSACGFRPRGESPHPGELPPRVPQRGALRGAAQPPQALQKAPAPSSVGPFAQWEGCAEGLAVSRRGPGSGGCVHKSPELAEQGGRLPPSRPVSSPAIGCTPILSEPDRRQDQLGARRGDTPVGI